MHSMDISNIALKHGSERERDEGEKRARERKYT